MQNREITQTGFLKVSIDNGVAMIAIDRPERRNAMTQAMWTEMAALFQTLSGKPAIRAIVLTGAGGDFCAGADIGEFDVARGTAEKARVYEAGNSAAFAAIRECPVPTIAAISGICFGGGFGLAAACDMRIASETALFCIPAARLGLAYPADAMADIVEALGPQMARYLAFSAARLNATAALDAGFLLEIAERGGLELRAAELGATIAANAPLSVKASKAAIRACLTPTPQNAAHAVELGDATFESADYTEGRAAFREKRHAVFAGR